MKIVIDGMGGDNAPQSVVEGACMAVNEYNVDIVITGDEEKIKKKLEKHSCDKNKISIVPTTEVITNDEKPVSAIRKKTNSSMAVALKMVKEKQADVIISAGSTGALLSGSIFILKRIKGITRPCICTSIPTINGGITMLSDTGANVDCNTRNLHDFAIMTNIYTKKVLNVVNPRIALANIGTEEGKGNQLVKDSFDDLKNEKSINFIGNIETREILNGESDIVICDGFIGNIIVKTVEGSVMSLFKSIKKVMSSSLKYKLGALLLKDGFTEIKELLDYSSVGGAPFLGVDGGVIKAHGSSDSKAIKNAIRQGIELCRGDVVNEIKLAIQNKTDNEEE